MRRFSFDEDHYEPIPVDIFEQPYWKKVRVPETAVIMVVPSHPLWSFAHNGVIFLESFRFWIEGQQPEGSMCARVDEWQAISPWRRLHDVPGEPIKVPFSR